MQFKFDFGIYTSGTRSHIKLKLEVHGFNLEECAIAYQKIGVTLTNGTLCAGGEGGKDSCNGDSGNALIMVI